MPTAKQKAYGKSHPGEADLYGIPKGAGLPQLTNSMKPKSAKEKSNVPMNSRKFPNLHKKSSKASIPQQLSEPKATGVHHRSSYRSGGHE